MTGPQNPVQLEFKMISVRINLLKGKKKNFSNEDLCKCTIQLLPDATRYRESPKEPVCEGIYGLKSTTAQHNLFLNNMVVL